MNKLFILRFALGLFFTLTSITYSAEKAVTPENICGIWEGDFVFQSRGKGPGLSGIVDVRRPCKLLITQNLNGVFVYTLEDQSAVVRILDCQGEIVHDQILMRKKENPYVIRIKAKITEQNTIEGEGEAIHKGCLAKKGYLTKFKKVRDLTNEEKRLSLEELKKLIE